VAVNAAKEWIDRNLNGPLTLGFSISLKVTPPEGETLRDITRTEAMFPPDARSKACKHRHHDLCKSDDCACPCHANAAGKKEEK
jgi:hypothetical protein